MESIDLNQFENAEQIKAWLEAGQTIDLYEDDRILARIIPKKRAPQPNELTEFAMLNADEIREDRS